MPKNIINEQTEEKIKDYLLDNADDNKVSDVDDAKRRNDLNNIRSRKFNFKSKKFLFVLFLILAIVLIAAYFAYLKGQRSFDNEKVSVKIEVLSEVSSGEEIIFVIKYENKTNVELRNPRISFFTPKEFVFVSDDGRYKREGDNAVIVWDLDDLAPEEFGRIKFFGKVNGKKETKCEFNSQISYVPDNFNYEFQSANNKSKAKLKITAIPFEASIGCPEFALNGSETECVINYKNTSSRSFKNVEVKVIIPSDFVYVSSEPEADKNEMDYLIWNIENLNSKESGELTIKGNVAGNENEEKEIEIILSASESDENSIEYLNEKVTIKIQEIPIILSQTINGEKEYFAYKGEELEYRIKIKNNSDTEIKGLVINSKLEGCVDPDSIEVVNGLYDGERIIWSAFNIPKLAVFGAGEEEEVSFKIKVKGFIDINVASDKNFSVKNTALVREFDFDAEAGKIGKTITSNTAIVKLDASLFIRAKGYFNDDGRIKNSGVIPPEVGKKTEYTIHWNLNSLLNGVKNIRIVSVLPDDIKWTGNYIRSNGEIFLGDENNGVLVLENNIADDENNEIEDWDNFKEQEDEDQIKKERFYYNSETREIVWEIPMLDANTGIIAPAKEIVFQVSVIPEEYDIGKVIKIMNEVKVTAQDEFTGNIIETLDSSLTTGLPDDYSIGLEEGIVIVSS